MIIKDDLRFLEKGCLPYMGPGECLLREGGDRDQALRRGSGDVGARPSPLEASCARPRPRPSPNPSHCPRVSTRSVRLDKCYRAYPQVQRSERSGRPWAALKCARGGWRSGGQCRGSGPVGEAPKGSGAS